MTDTQVSSELVGSTEACTRLDISRSCLGQWLKNGRIRALKRLPSGYVFTGAEIARAKAENPPRAYAHRRRP